MTILPNYLYSYILKTIITYLYNDKPSIVSKKSFGIISNNNELIQYSLVSKSFKNIIKSILVQQLNYKNYHLLKNLIENNNNNSNINNSFKLIPIKDSIIVYRSLSEFEKDFNKKDYDSSIYKTIYLNTTGNDKVPASNKVLKNLENYPNNFIFNIVVSMEDLSLLNDIIESYKNQNKEIGQFKKIFISLERDISNEQFVKLIEAVLAFNPKIVDFGFQELYGLDFSILVESNKLQSLKLGDSIYPKYLSKIGSNSKLNKLLLCINHNYIIKYLKNQSSIGKFFHPIEDKKTNDMRSFEVDFNNMVINLSKQSSIKQLTIWDEQELNQFGQPFITKGFKQILSSSFTQIEILNLDQYVLFDNEIFDALSNNRTIKTLFLSNADLTEIISRILFKNKTIRNLIIRNFNIEKNLNGLEYLKNELNNNKNNHMDHQEYSKEINLYSLSFYISKNDKLVERYINSINSYSFPIKEFNLIVYYNKYFNLKKFQMISNNSIINYVMDLNEE